MHRRDESVMFHVAYLPPRALSTLRHGEMASAASTRSFAGRRVVCFAGSFKTVREVIEHCPIGK